MLLVNIVVAFALFNRESFNDSVLDILLLLVEMLPYVRESLRSSSPLEKITSKSSENEEFSVEAH